MGVEYPYPDALESEADDILDVARGQYRYHANNKGKADIWSDSEARFHYWKACDELFTATHLSKQDGTKAEQVEAVADAFNHMVMALAVYYEQRP